MSSPGRWSDLSARIMSALVIVIVALFAVFSGAHVFHVFIVVVCGLMIWELVRMLSGSEGSKAIAIAVSSAISILLAIHAPDAFVFPLLLAPAILGAIFVPKYRLVMGGYTALIALAGFEMTNIRDSFGLIWMFWLILIVVASDVAGYFAGRLLGGPKFWPRVSPKKTWSGTIAGWIGAALIGYGFATWQGVSLSLVPLSVLVAFAAQMGDIAESAIKRTAGVKDTSNLIPGHGGFLDRFDGMLGASFFVLLFSAVAGFSPGVV